jgi:transposase
LVQGLTPAYVVANRAYDSDPLVAARATRGIGAVLPPRRNRRHPRPYQAARYAQRQAIERLFSRLKHFRRLATRYEKLAPTVLWLRDC